MFRLNQHRAAVTLGFSCLVLLLFGIESAQADVYKWVDREGKVHYSDQPPPTGEAKKLKQTSKDTGSNSSATPVKSQGAEPNRPPTTADKDLEYRRRRVEAEEAQKKEQVAQAQAQQKQAYCGSLKGNLKTLETGGRIVKYNEKGEQLFLDDETRKDELTRVKRELEENCK